MSQFMLCKTKNDLTSYNCKKIEQCLVNKQYLIKIASELFRVKTLNDVWAVTDIDLLFTQVQNQSFENTELHMRLSALFDVCDVILLWYSNFYDDLDEVNTKEQFISTVKDSVNDPSGMCECYLYVNCLNTSV